MKYNFDRHIERRGTGAVKYECIYDGERLPSDVLPMWIADMDFACPPAVLDASRAACDTEIFGYTDLLLMPDYYRAVCDYYRRRFDWYINSRDIVITPGIVSGIAYAVEALTRLGDGVIIQPPVYYPFGSIVDKYQRRVISNPLIEENGRYTIDFDDLEKKAAVRTTTMLIFCSPHNPVGRVWTVEELTRLHEICEQNGIIIVSDEIHCDLTRTGVRHYPLAALFPRDKNIVTCTAPSKTFNIAGLSRSHLVVRDEELRRKLERFSTTHTSPVTAAAVKAALSESDEWLDSVREYLDGSYEHLTQLIKKLLPLCVISPAEAMYLAWIDVRPYTKNTRLLEKNLLKRTGVYIEAGEMFGKEGAGHIRVNFACPRRDILRFANALKSELDRVKEDDELLEFTLPSAWGGKQTVTKDGKKKIIIFLRHVGCSFTQLYLARLSAAYEQLAAEGVKLLVITQNSAVALESRLNRKVVPYYLLSDRDGEVSRLYRIPSAASAGRLITEHELADLRLIRDSNLKDGTPEGDELALPAVFIADAYNRFEYVKYGTSASDIPTPLRLLKIIQNRGDV